VPEGRFTLVELYEGPVAELVVEKSVASASHTSPAERSEVCQEPVGVRASTCLIIVCIHFGILFCPGRGCILIVATLSWQDACSCLQLANEFVAIVQGDRRDCRADAIDESKYFRNISSIKIRGNASSARPLSAILNPLMQTIEERLSSIDSMKGGRRSSIDSNAMLEKDRRSMQGTAKDHDMAPVDNFVDVSNAAGHGGERAIDLSSDTDAHSLTYNASVLTIQVVLSQFLR
jgi:hypothetical protein